MILSVWRAATKRQDDWRPEQNTASWTGGGMSSTMGGERTSRGQNSQQGAFSTPAWKVSAAGVGGVSVQPTRKPDTTSYVMTNMIDEPNQQGLAQTNDGAGGCGLPLPNVVAVALPVMLALTKIIAL